jgi:putative tryptophan/tyrosine transport system substrate-binding protein
VIERRSAEGKPERLQDLAADPVRLHVDVIVTATTAATQAAQRATTTIPIVFALADEPVELDEIEVQEASKLSSAFASMTAWRAEALLVLPHPMFVAHRTHLAELAAKHRLPSTYHLKEFVEDGGLMSYAPDVADMSRRAAGYVDKILKGAKPGDLPVEQPTKFELVVNLKTAKALGLTIPQSILLQADEVIQ